ncbi:MAG TPA: dTMP kinase, partial [Angustibacter sp.]|nr:dTMP kinase [Angustibacter sp.]
TLLGLEVGDDVRGRTFAFVQSMVRVVLISVLAIGPVVAAGFSKGLGLPHTVHLTDDVSLTYTGVMATFLLAGLIAMAIGLVSFRQMDDRPGVSLVKDLVQAMRQRHLHHPPARRDPYPGRFVVFEGGDGAGKSTQVRLLGQWLHDQGYRARLTHEPGATPVGHRLREVLLHGDALTPRAEALLFAADRAHHVESVVRPALEDGEIVVSDRFIDSSVAYQGTGRDLGTTEVAQLSRWATQGLTPDLTVVLDVEPHEGRSRRGDEHDRLEAEPDDFHHRIRERFLELARRAPSRYLVVDAALAPDDIHAQVVRRLQGVLPESPVARAAREEREAREAAERAEREAREAAERAEREAREAAEREGRERREAQERAQAERLRAERQAAERAKAEQEAAEQARAEREAQQAAEAERRREQERWEASQPQDPTQVQPPVDVTAPLPKVTTPQPPSRVRSAKPRRRPRPDADTVPLDEEIFGLGEQGDR